MGWAWPWEIDSLGVSPALQLCYARALAELRVPPSTLIVDGSNHVGRYGGKQIVEPKADVNHIEVSAASMIAKHLRDTMMVDYGKQFPEYGFARNFGYGTHEHEEGIKTHGICSIHRLLYVRKVLSRLGRSP